MYIYNIIMDVSRIYKIYTYKFEFDMFEVSPYY